MQYMVCMMRLYLTAAMSRYSKNPKERKPMQATLTRNKPARLKVTSEHFQVKIGIFMIYKCPSCYGSGVKESYKYCPYCGVPLVFPKKQDEEEDK